jgi:F0F1-type ATP synthase membrane subunit b/b'
MLNESFWIFLSFVFLIGILFKFIKKSVISTLDCKIRSVEDSITNGAEMKKSAHEKLLSLKVDYEKALLQYENIISEAKTEAENIIRDTEARVKLLDDRYLDLISEYRRQSDTAMVESLKGDILMTILNLIENEQKQDSVAQMKGVGNSISVMKKIWN